VGDNTLASGTTTGQGAGTTETSPNDLTIGGVVNTCPECNGDHDYIYYYVNEQNQIAKKVISQARPIGTYRFAMGTVYDPSSQKDLNSIHSPASNVGGGLGALPLWAKCSGSDCRNNWALLIDGGYDNQSNHMRYFNDISFMYQTLNKTYGYPKDHITVLMADGNEGGLDRNNFTKTDNTVLTDNTPVDLDSDGVAELTASSKATKNNLNTTLVNLNQTLRSNDTLFIFTTGHGGNDTRYYSGVNSSLYYLWNQESINDTEFVGKLPTTPGNITMVMEQCNSGGFVDNFATNYGGGQKRIIATAANGSEPSRGNGFSNAWTKGVAMIKDDTFAQSFDADTSSPANQNISMSEAFNYANVNDPSALDSLANHEHPQYETKNIDGATRYLLSGTCTNPVSIQVVTPNTAETWVMYYPRTIRWTSTGVNGNVDIELWNKSASQAMQRAVLITTTVPASQGFYNWTIPTTLKASTSADYWIKISSNTTRTVNDTSDTAFLIKSRGNTVVLKVNSTPNGGAQIYLDGWPNTGVNSGTMRTTNISWSADPGSHVITVKKDGYLDQSAGFTLTSGLSFAGLNFALEPITAGNFPDSYGTISVDSIPMGAEVYKWCHYWENDTL